MQAQKLFLLLLSVVFAVGTAGLAVAAEGKKVAAKTKTAQGTVKSVSESSLVIEGKDMKEMTFAISGKVAEAAKKLKAGEAVKISYTEDGGKMTASRVVMAKGAKKAANPCAAAKPAEAKK